MPNQQLITIGERFDYSSYRTFYDQCEAAIEQPGVDALVMDFRKTRYLDSAALGMLVQIQRKARDKKIAAKIIRAEGVVLETLQIANMAKLYEFE